MTFDKYIERNYIRSGTLSKATNLPKGTIHDYAYKYEQYKRFINKVEADGVTLYHRNNILLMMLIRGLRNVDNLSEEKAEKLLQEQYDLLYAN